MHRNASDVTYSAWYNPMVMQKSTWSYLAFLTATFATIGSLVFSELFHFPPCVLCWYQRICMYPLFIILGVGILERNKNMYKYVLPLSFLGEIIAIYHNLLYYKILPESAAPCIAGVSCTTKFIEYFGFITIPFLSLVAFTIINVCMVIYLRTKGKEVL